MANTSWRVVTCSLAFVRPHQCISTKEPLIDLSWVEWIRIAWYLTVSIETETACDIYFCACWTTQSNKSPKTFQKYPSTLNLTRMVKQSLSVCRFCRFRHRYLLKMTMMVSANECRLCLCFVHFIGAEWV